VFRCRMSRTSCSIQPQVLVSWNFCSKPIAYDGLGAVGQFAGRPSSVYNPPPPLAKLKVLPHFCPTDTHNCFVGLFVNFAPLFHRIFVCLLVFNQQSLLIALSISLKPMFSTLLLIHRFYPFVHRHCKALLSSFVINGPL